MDINLLFVLILIVIGFMFISWWIQYQLSHKSFNFTDQTLLEWLKSTQSSLNSTTQVINESLKDSHRELHQTLHRNTQTISERLDKTAHYTATLAQQIGSLSEIGRSMKDLQEFLRNPKLRGNIGEEVLQDLISQMFPKHAFNLQYTFNSGAKVDAALKTEAGILPIDAKFPIDNFRKLISSETEEQKTSFRKAFINDVKKHVRDIAGKYILPQEGTLDFAIMYIPSEPVYYEIVNQPQLIDYARQSRVYLVSPSTLYALLQTILLSFEGKKIEAQSKKIFQLLRAIQTDYQKTTEHLATLNKHLSNAYTKMSEVNHSYGLMGQKLTQTQILKE